MLNMCQMTRRITSAGGELTSPRYPDNYPAHVDCMCTLSADDPSARLVLSLYDLALQTRNGRCRADWLMLREGARNVFLQLVQFRGLRVHPYPRVYPTRPVPTGSVGAGN